MTDHDPNTCRRALRDISEIAAVAVLQDSRMTEPEALAAIAAIARWVDEEGPRQRADCGAVIRRLHRMTEGADFEAIDDREAVRLFRDVLVTLSEAEGRPDAQVDGARPLI